DGKVIDERIVLGPGRAGRRRQPSLRWRFYRDLTTSGIGRVTARAREGADRRRRFFFLWMAKGTRAALRVGTDARARSLVWSRRSGFRDCCDVDRLGLGD